jgi:hypothetical protein
LEGGVQAEFLIFRRSLADCPPISFGKGGQHVKRILWLPALLLLSGVLCSPAFANHQDHSFTYWATAGMFEDMYDYFSYSPAYMPTFQKNAFWGQLSNLQYTDDLLFDNDASNSYLVGGQMEFGPGRLGVMLDWYSYVSPIYNVFYNGYGHNGFGEGTYEQYFDRDADNIIDARQETYGRSDYSDKSAQMDVYAAYALGAIMGFDLGAGVRGQWDSYNPTYFSGPLGGYKGSFNLSSYNRQYDLITGQQIWDWSENGSGSYSSGDALWKLILGGRSKDLMPGMDVVVNLVPEFYSWSSKVDWNYAATTLYNPWNTALIHDDTETYKVSGVYNEPYYGQPASGSSLGIGANARTDFALIPGVLFTGTVDFETHAWNPKDQKYEYAYSDVFRDTVMVLSVPTVQTETTNNSSTYKFDEKGGITSVKVGLRTQFPAKGWRLGLGLNAGTNSSSNETTLNFNYTGTNRFNANDGVPADSYTDTTTETNVVKYTYEEIYDTLEIPVGLIIDLLSNLNLQFGAMHTITARSYTYKSALQSQSMRTTVRTYDNGASSTTSISLPDDFNAYQISNYSVSQSTDLSYGMTWWPYERVQIDFTGFYNLTNLANYRLSVNLYF